MARVGSDYWYRLVQIESVRYWPTVPSVIYDYWLAQLKSKLDRLVDCIANCINCSFWLSEGILVHGGAIINLRLVTFHSNIYAS